MWFIVICFYYTSAYHVDNPSNVAGVLDVEGGFLIYYYLILKNVMLDTDM